MQPTSLLVLAAWAGLPAALAAQTVLTPAAALDDDLMGLGSSHLEADFDGDGDVDVALLPTFDALRMLFNDGEEVFFEVPTFVRGIQRLVLASDVDEDDDVDLVVGLLTGEAAVLLNPGDGSFGAPVPLPSQISGVVFGQAADLDGDTHVDLVLEFEGEVSVLHGDGAGGFTEAQFMDIGSSLFFLPTRYQLADIDEDGQPELVVGRALFQTPEVFPGLAGGTFGTTGTTIEAGPGATSYPWMADVDGDGDPDLLWGSDDGLRLRRGQPGPFFAPAQLTPGNELNIQGVADLNGDGVLDVSTFSGSSGNIEDHVVYAGLGNGRFVRDAVADLEGGLFEGRLHDLDGDGDDDLVMLLGGFLTWMRNATPGAGEPWADLGVPLEGTPGWPQLVVTGEDAPGGVFRFQLHNALPGAVPRLVGSFTQVNAPFLGGLLVPAFEYVFFLPPVNLFGDVALMGHWPAVASGQQFTIQMWIPDPAGPFGYVSTTAVAIDVP